MKCKSNSCDNVLTGRQRTFCSDKCRMSQSRTQSRTEQTRTVSRTIIDCTGKEHPIDYEGRRKTRALLKSWARGEGSEYQRRLGVLAKTYSVIHNVDEQRYLGYA